MSLSNRRANGHAPVVLGVGACSRCGGYVLLEYPPDTGCLNCGAVFYGGTYLPEPLRENGHSGSLAAREDTREMEKRPVTETAGPPTGHVQAPEDARCIVSPSTSSGLSRAESRGQALSNRRIAILKLEKRLRDASERDRAVIQAAIELLRA